MKTLIYYAIAIIVLISACVLIDGMAEGAEIEDLVPFIIMVESSGNPSAVSHCGAIGLMQITPIVLKEWNATRDTRLFSTDIRNHRPYRYLKNLFDPEKNITIGTWYLERLKNHYLKDSYTDERMLAAYNGGITRLRRLLRQGKDWQDMPRESVNYVKKVMKLYKESK